MGRFIDLTDKKFGKLTVVCYAGKNKFGGSLWKCICECGREKTVMALHLRNGRTRTCGDGSHRIGIINYEHQYQDLTSMRFGRLTVIKRINDNTIRNPTWECVCECGNRANITGSSLRSGDSQSCG